MIIRFGLELQEQVFPAWDEQVDANCGEKGLLVIIEEHLGLGYPDSLDFLRVEQYRQLLQHYKEKQPDVFYAASFDADALATAEALLNRRDELVLAGWDFETSENSPTRLSVLAGTEAMLQAAVPTEVASGYADRFQKVMSYLEEDISIPLKEIWLNEPLTLLPPYLQRLLAALEKRGVIIKNAEQISSEADNDLSNFKKALLKQPYDKGKSKADGSLIILRSRSEAYAATYLAKLFALNKDYRPLCLLSDKNRAFDNALIQEGLPSFGVLSASLARPTLQILKLVPTFLWSPVNPFKLLEFLSLPNIPLQKNLAIKLAAAISEKPGLFNSAWFAKRNAYFEELAEKMEKGTKKNKETLNKEKQKAEKDYNFWFERKRYDIRTKVPAREVIDIFDHVKYWALSCIEDIKNKLDKLDKNLEKKAKQSDELMQSWEKQKEELLTAQQPMLTLYQQANRVVLVLETLPENEQSLSYLQLERLVKTINEPVQMPFRYAEIGHAPFVYNPSAIAVMSENTLWWNFVDNGQSVGFERWYAKELQFLQGLNVTLESLQTANLRLLWQRMRPVLQTKQQLLLVMPDAVNGRSCNPHPLWGDLHAAFGKELSAISVNLESEENIEWFASFFKLTNKTPVPQIQLLKPQPFVRVQKPSEKLQAREVETFTSMDTLLYYPYQWVFRYLLGLNKSSILSIVREETLKGNLAHEVFQRLFNDIKSSNRHWKKEEVQNWIELQMPPIIERDGAVMLMYGQEAERIGFVNLMKHSTWSLVSSIQENNWEIEGTEMDLEGLLGEQKIKGKADLILIRDEERAVIDLKFHGTEKYKRAIKDMEDLQLVIYASLAAKSEGDWAHTAYYIISQSRLLTRNNFAFKEAEALMPGSDYKAINTQIRDKMIATYLWRINQIKNGKIEVRNEHTADMLEKELMDTGELLSLLEMQSTPPPYDMYKVLVGNYR